MFQRDRTGKKETFESADEMLLQMLKPLPPGSLVVADLYFGSLKALEKLIKDHKHALLSCTQNCPGLLFKDLLVDKLQNNEDNKSIFGEIERNGEKIPFIANGFCSEN